MLLFVICYSSLRRVATIRYISKLVVGLMNEFDMIEGAMVFAALPFHDSGTVFHQHDVIAYLWMKLCELE